MKKNYFEDFSSSFLSFSFFSLSRGFGWSLKLSQYQSISHVMEHNKFEKLFFLLKFVKHLLFLEDEMVYREET